MNLWVHLSNSLYKRRTKVDTTYPVVLTVDDTTYNFTEDSLREFIKESNARRDVIAADRNVVSDLYKKLAIIRGAVYDFFNERHTSGDTEIVMDVELINELLESIGADKLRNLYEATVILTVTVQGIEAADEEEVKDIVNDNIYAGLDSYDVVVDQIDIDEVRES